MGEKTISMIIDVAIEREERAYAFYRELSGKVADRTAQETLQYLSGEEKKHKEFLEKYRQGDLGPESLRMTDVVDYKIAEYLVKPDIQKNMDSRMYTWWRPIGNSIPIISTNRWPICIPMEV
jgi:rubrerythrin